MAELDLIAPGPLTGVSVHPLAPLVPDPRSAIPVEEEDVDSLGKPGEETQGQGCYPAKVGAPGDEGEEEILCDFCLGASRVRAVKSCLTCMVNYCEEHLRPHQENSKLHSHQLTEPAKDRDLRTCPAHHSPLVAFCYTHQQCICQQCGEGEHRGHSTVSLDAARRNKEADLRCMQLDLEQKLKLNENAITRLQANHKSVLVSVSEVKVVAEEKFGELLAAVRKAQADVMLFLEEKEQAALNQVNGIKTHLEYRSIEMEKSKQELEKLATISNTALFLERNMTSELKCLPLSSASIGPQNLSPEPGMSFSNMHVTSHLTQTQHIGTFVCRRTTARSPTPHPGSIPTRTSPAGFCTGGRCCPNRVCTCTGIILKWRSLEAAPMLA
ncbi:tripartite motif-containing protein 16 isoform X2 [Onychomys torridus]|uniref:tripartite motif-containing protein 16 isoform X2 n=1 Tax=Onychomys torridus TaxID=38674 RepID=UPI00167FC55F|nr:tripartite motif-containing protein 16 isoform X2 [Onychomys torridus]